MAFDVFSTVSLPSATTIADAQSHFDQISKRIADLPGVSVLSRLTDTGPQREDMTAEQRALLIYSQRLIPYTRPPGQTVQATVGTTAISLPVISNPLIIPTSPRMGIAFEVAPGCHPFWCWMGYLDESLVPVPPPGMELIYRAFCRPGWQGQSMVMTETAMAAKDGGIPNAVAAHLASIGILDRMREVGFTLRVSDQDDYQTHRDVKRLVQTFNRVRQHRMGQGQVDLSGLLAKLTQALGADHPRIEQIGGPTKEYVGQLRGDPDALRKVKAEDRILDLLRVVDRTPRPEDPDDEDSG